MRDGRGIQKYGRWLVVFLVTPAELCIGQPLQTG